MKPFRDLVLSGIVSLEFLLICVATLLNVLTPDFLKIVGSTLKANKEGFQWLTLACVATLVLSLRWAHEILVPKHEHAAILAEWPEFYMIKNRTLVGVCYVIAGTCVALTMWILGIDLRVPRVAATYCASVAIVMTAALTLWYASIQLILRLRRIHDR